MPIKGNKKREFSAISESNFSQNARVPLISYFFGVTLSKRPSLSSSK